MENMIFDRGNLNQLRWVSFMEAGEPGGFHSNFVAENGFRIRPGSNLLGGFAARRAQAAS